MFILDLNKAIQIAVEVHKNQLDKGGNPYILHPLRLMLQMNDEKSMIVAVLHDVIEDDLNGSDKILAEKPDADIFEALINLTHIKGESYDNYIKRVKTNELSTKVKIEDLKDNMDLNRLKTITQKDYVRREKYSKALGYLRRKEKFSSSDLEYSD